MTSDPNDELAPKRAERDRARRPRRTDGIGDAAASPEQEAAIMRARESWTLSRPEPGQTSPSGTTE